MNPFQRQLAQLAFKADRRILALHEEDHLRLDLSAHEAVALALPKQKSKTLLWVKDYSFMALMLFTLMFLLSSLPSYAKLSMANLSEARQASLASVQPTQAYQLTEDPWTGEKLGTVLPTLSAKEHAELTPEASILPVLGMPTSLEDRISIPSLKVNAPLVQPSLGLESLQSEDWNELEEQIRSSLLQGVVHYPGTAEPGKKGNFFVTGHSSNVFWESSDYNSVFARLPKIEIGDEILVTKDQQEFKYLVTEMKEVSPKDVSVLSQGEGYQMTLMTCTPVGTTFKRLVVTAELQSSL